MTFEVLEREMTRSAMTKTLETGNHSGMHLPTTEILPPGWETGECGTLPGARIIAAYADGSLTECELVTSAGAPNSSARHPLACQLRLFQTGPTDNPANANLDARAAHTELIQEVRLSGSAAYLRSISPYELIASGAKSYVLGKIVDGRLKAYAGFYVYRMPDRRIYVGGVVTGKPFEGHGVMAWLMADRLREIAMGEPDAGFVADVRIGEMDGLNLRAYRLFRSLGLRELEIREFPLTATDTAFRPARGREGFLALRMRTEPGWKDDVDAILKRRGRLP
jgi:hypothetical protein